MFRRLWWCGLVAACSMALVATGQAAPPATGGDSHPCLYGGTWAARVVGNPLKGISVGAVCSREWAYVALEGEDGYTYVFFAGIASANATITYDTIRASGLRGTKYSAVTFQAIGLDSICLPGGRPSRWVMFTIGTGGTLAPVNCPVPPG